MRKRPSSRESVRVYEVESEKSMRAQTANPSLFGNRPASRDSNKCRRRSALIMTLLIELVSGARSADVWTCGAACKDHAAVAAVSPAAWWFPVVSAELRRPAARLPERYDTTHAGLWHTFSWCTAISRVRASGSSYMLTPPWTPCCAEKQTRGRSQERALNLAPIVCEIVSLRHLFSARPATFGGVPDQERARTVTWCIVVWVSPSVQFKASAHVWEGTKLLTAGDIFFSFFSLPLWQPSFVSQSRLVILASLLTGPRCRSPLRACRGVWET